MAETIENEVVQDVSDSAADQEQTEVEQQPVKALTPREEKLKQLYADYDNADTQHFDPDNVEADDGEEDLPPEAYTKPEEEEAGGQANSPVFKDESGEWKMRLKVNGVEVVRSLEEVQRTAQKDAAADQRLREASEKQRQLQDYERQLQAETQRLQQMAQQNTQPSKQDAGEMRESARQLLEQIYDGNTEEATGVLVQLLSGRDTATLDPNQLTQQAVQQTIAEMDRREQAKTAAQTQKDFNASVNRGIAHVNENYSDLLKDPDAYRLIDLKTEDLERAHPDKTPEEIIKLAAEDVAKKFGRTKTEPKPTNTRQQNKEGIVRMPAKQSGARHTNPRPTEQDNSPESAVERMKARRNGYQNRPVN